MIMKTKAILLGTAALMFVLTSEKAIAQIGTPYIHDPSTIMECDGKYYTFGTGGGGLISEDGWTWNGGGVRPGGGAAPDAVKIGDRYLIAYSATGGGLGGGHSGKVLTMWNKTLDPNSPDFKYTEPIEVASSVNDEDCDAIDAGLLLDPTDGRLWLSYGTYFGFIRLVELDPATGKRMEGNKEINIAIDCEAFFFPHYRHTVPSLCASGRQQYCRWSSGHRSKCRVFLEDNTSRHDRSDRLLHSQWRC